MKKLKSGYFSSILTLFFGSLYILALLFSLMGYFPKPWDTFWQLLPSIFLAWSFMTTMAIVFKYKSDSASAWPIIGLSFAIIYATINSIVYFTELTVVIPKIIENDYSSLSLLLFEPGKFLFAINGLAYTLMSVSALFVSFSFKNQGSDWFPKWALFAHGIVGPFILGAVLWAPLTYIGALWILTFPIMCIALMRYFK